MLKVLVGYPGNETEELTVVNRSLDDPPDVRQGLPLAELAELQQTAEEHLRRPGPRQLRGQPRGRDPRAGHLRARRHRGAARRLRRKSARADRARPERARRSRSSTAATT